MNKQQKRNYQRPFLKWAGGKYRLLGEILPHLPQQKTRLVEPFIGSGVVSINTDYDSYLMADANPDLINLYQLLKDEGDAFIKHARRWFTQRTNTEAGYYSLRDRFNRCTDIEKRGYYFLALNRHCFNGLTRYSKKVEKTGFRKFNVPRGRYNRIYYPEAELRFFYEKLKRTELMCADFRDVLQQADHGSVYYIDPPYSALHEQKTNFTAYDGNEFSTQDQHDLVELVHGLSTQGIPCLLSNHNTQATRNLYRGAVIKKFQAPRSISRDATQRKGVSELLAIF